MKILSEKSKLKINQEKIENACDSYPLEVSAAHDF